MQGNLYFLLEMGIDSEYLPSCLKTRLCKCGCLNELKRKQRCGLSAQVDDAWLPSSSSNEAAQMETCQNEPG